MKTRVISLLIALCLVIGLIPVTANAALLDNGLQYEVYEDHVAITGYSDNATEVTIPAEIEGLPVTRISSSAFYGCKNLTSIDLPNSVTYIGDYAFCNCSSLTSIFLPDSVTFIGDYAFCNCSSLTSIDLPNSVTQISSSAFAQCSSLTSISIPDGVTEISSSAFSNCSSLEHVSIPNSVTAIGVHAFAGCSSLSSITIPASVTFLNYGAFQDCSNLTSIYFEGDAPEIYYSFDDVNATAYYPGNNATWTEDMMQDYGGEITWVPYIPNPFTDVPADSFYHDPVMWAIEKNITNGLSADTFGPFATCNRAQVVTFLWRAAGCPEPTSTRNPFVDVQAGSFYEKPVLWAVEKGITNGSDATHFGPTGVCNRAQVVTFLYRAFGSPAVSTEGLPFTDVPAGSWYEAPIAWAVANGITNGLSATEFGPVASCNRAQVVTFLYRAYND